MEAKPPKAEQPKRKRRWFQFSLRTLLIFTLIVAIACAWLGRKIERKRKEREAVEATVKLGGLVTCDYEKAGVAEPPGPDWLRNLLGEYFFSEVVSVDRSVPHESDASVSDAELVNLKGFTQLQTLQIAGADVTDAGLEHLKGLTQFHRLVLRNTKVTDAGLEHLKGLTQLRTLDLGSTKVTDAGLANLNSLPQLQDLYLDSTQVTGAGLQHLEGLTQLQRLILRDTDWTVRRETEWPDGRIASSVTPVSNVRRRNWKRRWGLQGEGSDIPRL
jgi:hypothetical protein